jgi:hypothetical protein
MSDDSFDRFVRFGVKCEVRETLVSQESLDGLAVNHVFLCYAGMGSCIL